jgi:choline monooxygenase
VDPARLSEEIDRFDPRVPIESAWTPPSSWYTAPDIHALECRAVLAATWQPVARLEQLQRPGDFVAGCLLGEPFVVVRGADDVLRAFHNTCRHKGREVVQGAGTAQELVCGYHAWTYDLAGKLRSAPRMAGIRDFDRERMSLPPLALETWGPWVFLDLSGSAPPLAPRLAELDARLADTDWQRLRFVERSTWTLACNWKVYVDNYLDGGYHIPHMHPSLDAQVDMSGYRTELFENYSIQSAPPASRAGERIGQGALYARIWPNFMLNRYGPCLDTNYVVPLGPERCEVRYEFFFEERDGEEARRFIAQSIEQSAVTQREDIAICESVQLGLGSRGYDRGRYAPQVETGEHHFHRLLAGSYRSALDGGRG